MFFSIHIDQNKHNLILCDVILTSFIFKAENKKLKRNICCKSFSEWIGKYIKENVWDSKQKQKTNKKQIKRTVLNGYPTPADGVGYLNS